MGQRTRIRAIEIEDDYVGMLLASLAHNLPRRGCVGEYLDAVVGEHASQSGDEDRFQRSEDHSGSMQLVHRPTLSEPHFAG